MIRTVVHYTDSTGFGGAERAIVQLLAGLDRARWRPILYHHPATGLAPLLVEAARLDVPTFAIPAMPLGAAGARRVPGLVNRLRRQCPSVFHAHLTWPLACKYGLVAAIVARVPAVVATGQLFMELPYTRTQRLQWRLLATGLDRLIAVSPDVAQRYHATFGIPMERMTVIPNSVRLADFQPMPIVEQAAAHDGSRPARVLTVARLDPQKGLGYLLEAAREVPDALFQIAGDGPERVALETQARTLGVAERVEFLGFREDIPALLAACDIFVLPSLYEGLPLALLEALAAGKPVVATAIPGNHEVVSDGETGLLVPAADGMALATAIQALIACPTRARRLAAAGRLAVGRSYSVEQMVARVSGLYAELLDQPSMRRASPDQAERRRNRLLRRADWRFLLPRPVPTCSVCFADGLLAAAVASISGRMVDACQQPGDQCDLAVAVDPSREQLRRAWTLLCPGGISYTEWYAPRVGAVAAIRRRLKAAGFVDLQMYLAWPPPQRWSAARWVPLDVPAAAAYLLTQPPGARRQDRVRQRLLLGGWRVARRTGLLRPICVVARKPEAAPAPSAAGEATAASPPDDLAGLIERHWQGWGFSAAPRSFAPLLLAGGRHSSNKVVALVFGAEGAQPPLAIKFARVPESVAGLRREADALRAVHASHPAASAGVPRLLFDASDAPAPAIGETVMLGRPLYRTLSAATHRSLAHLGTAWLSRLVADAPPRPRGDWWPFVAQPIVEGFDAAFRHVSNPSLMDDASARLARLDRLPRACEQRDFSPWNVLVTPAGELAVLDWESAEPAGLPLLDLVYYLSYLAFFVDDALDRGQTRASYRAALDPRTPSGSITAACLRAYAERAGIDMAALHPLRLLTWMLHALAEHERLLVAGVAQSRQSIFLGLWEEEARHGGAPDQGGWRTT